MSNWFTRIFTGREQKTKPKNNERLIGRSSRYRLDQQSKTLTIKQEANIKITKSAVGNKFLIKGTIGGVEINETIVLSGQQKLQIIGSSQLDQIEISDRASESISKLDPGAGNDVVKVTYNPEMEIDFSQGKNTLITRTGTTRADRYKSSSPMKVIVPDLDSQTFLDDSGEKATNLGSRKLESSTLFDPNRDPNIPNTPGTQATKNIAKIDVVNTDDEKIAKLEYGTAIRESETKFFGFTRRTRDRGWFFTEIPTASSSATEISSTSSPEQPTVIAVPDSAPEATTEDVQQGNPKTNAAQTQTTSIPSSTTPEETVSTPVKETSAPSVANTAATTTEATDSTVEEKVLKNTQQPNNPEKIGFELVKRGDQKVFVVKFKESILDFGQRPTISQNQDGTIIIQNSSDGQLGTFGTDGIDLIEIDLSSKESSSSDRNIANDFITFENMRSDFTIKLGSGVDVVDLKLPREEGQATNQQIHLIGKQSRRLDLYTSPDSGTAIPKIYIEGIENPVSKISASSPTEKLIIHIKKEGEQEFTSYQAVEDSSSYHYKLEKLSPATN